VTTFFLIELGVFISQWIQCLSVHWVIVLPVVNFCMKVWLYFVCLHFLHTTQKTNVDGTTEQSGGAGNPVHRIIKNLLSSQLRESLDKSACNNNRPPSLCYMATFPLSRVGLSLSSMTSVLHSLSLRTLFLSQTWTWCLQLFSNNRNHDQSGYPELPFKCHQICPVCKWCGGHSGCEVVGNFNDLLTLQMRNSKGASTRP
jgi:hypothetical protein